LANLYTQQRVQVQWGDHISPEFRVSNGVKQGGVLSPVLLGIYIDELIDGLKNAGFACHIGHIFCDAFAFADDVITLAPSC
jgi:hypothetical protein